MAQRIPLTALVFTLVLSLLSPFSTAQASPLQQSAPPAQGRVTTNANLRAGPGSSFAKVGAVTAGTIVDIAACNTACDWYQIDANSWIAAFLVEPIADSETTESLATVQPQPAILPTTTPTAPQRSSGATGKGAAASTGQLVSTGTPASIGPVASTTGNLRAGPGTNYPIAGSVQQGQSLEITGRTAAGDWLQLSGGNWVAAFLVANAPASSPVVEAPSAPEPTVAAVDEVFPLALALWDDQRDFNTTRVCGNFEYRLTKAWRTKSLWMYNREYIAQGEWLLVFVEVKNISPGTSYFGAASPRVLTMTSDERMSRLSDDYKASSYAGWMYQHGRFWEDINPGIVLGLVAAYDLPIEPDKLVGFGMLACPDKLLSLGSWSKVLPSESK